MDHRLEHHGCDLSYSVHGEGPPVLLVQGVGVNGSGWGPQVDVLQDHYACMTFDNRGIGESMPAGCDITVEQLAADCVALMDAHGWPSAHVIGHSLGGAIALQLALTQPARVRSLALLCTFACGKACAPMTWRMLRLGTGTRLGTRKMRRKAFLGLVLPPGALATVDTDALAARMGSLFGHDLADQPPIVGKQLAAIRTFDVRSRLKELATIPTLVVSAEHDPIAPPASGRAIAAGIPGSRYVEAADASHGLPIVSADWTNKLLLEHLAAHSGVG